VKKDILSRAEGPMLRVNSMHLSIPKAKINARDEAADVPVVQA